MKNRLLRDLLKLGVFTSAAVLALSARADLRQPPRDDRQIGRHDDDARREHDDDDEGSEHGGRLPLATGQYITPRATTTPGAAPG